MSLINFNEIFKKDVAPIYINHQKTFDAYCMHGCLHISRSLIICRALCNMLSARGLSVDIDKISYAVAFHDSGRCGNGIDFWEQNSKGICYDYLTKNNIPDATYISNLIVKDNSKNDYNYLCVYDTDVLEIMRPCSGIGVLNFNKSYLRLSYIFNDYPFINEIIPFILETESNKGLYSDENSLSNLITLISNNKEKYPTLHASILS